MTDEPAASQKGGGVSWPILIGVGAFLALSGVFASFLLQTGRDASTIPSVLIGRQAPLTPLPAVPGLVDPAGSPLPGFEPALFAGQVTLVNVWASWCGPCREEHPLLMDLARVPQLQIFGINYKDKPEQAAGFVGRLGNPYDAVGADQTGRTAIEWGVYGVPETYLVGPDGAIAYKHVGPLTPEVVRDTILPEIERLSTPAG